MISVRLFFTFSFVLFNSSVYFVYSSEFRKECMSGISLESLRKEHDRRLEQLRQTDDYVELQYRRCKFRQCEYDYKNADYTFNAKDIEKLQNCMRKSEDRSSSLENKLRQANKAFVDLRECIKEREFNQLPIK